MTMGCSTNSSTGYIQDWDYCVIERVYSATKKIIFKSRLETCHLQRQLHFSQGTTLETPTARPGPVIRVPILFFCFVQQLSVAERRLRDAVFAAPRTPAANRDFTLQFADDSCRAGTLFQDVVCRMPRGFLPSHI